MAEITLLAEIGRPTGSRPSRRLRAQGKVPAVVYGHGEEPRPVAVAWRDLRAALTTDAGLNALIDLHVDGDTKLAIVKDLQRDPVHQTVVHVDFLLISRTETITVDVPITVTGEAEAVIREEGLVEQVLSSIAVNALPGNIPNEFVVDVSELTMGDSIRVGDLQLPEGVTTDVDPEDPIVTTSLSSAAFVEEEEEAAEGEEGEEGELAEGEAPAGEEGRGEGGGGGEGEGGEGG